MSAICGYFLYGDRLFLRSSRSALNHQKLQYQGKNEADNIVGRRHLFFDVWLLAAKRGTNKNRTINKTESSGTRRNRSAHKEGPGSDCADHAKRKRCNRKG